MTRSYPPGFDIAQISLKNAAQVICEAFMLIPYAVLEQSKKHKPAVTHVVSARPITPYARPVMISTNKTLRPNWVINGRNALVNPTLGLPSRAN